MTPCNEPGPTRQLDVLHQLLTSATHEASVAMSRWTDGLISLSLDEVRAVPLEDAFSRLDMGEQLLTMVTVSLVGEQGGEIILTFDDHSGRELAASLLRKPPGSQDTWTEMERSALTETGNILACAYANALTRLVAAEMLPSVPTFVHDYGASVLEQAIFAQAAQSDTIVVSRTIFHRRGRELDWKVLFIPTVQLQNAMAEAVHVHG